MTPQNSQRTAIVIGSGFSSLSCAAFLASSGLQVRVIEKNEQSGGRARRMDAEGFMFDMGPSWYWMPEVFERFYQQFGKSTSDFYDLKRLDPSYRVVFGPDDFTDIPASVKELEDLFEKKEACSAVNLRKFLKDAAYNYDVAMNKVVHRPGFSLTELVMPETVRKAGAFLRSIRSQVRKNFKHPQLRAILEFPVLFLGAKPGNTPEFYNFMNHADLSLGTWYPMGGMHEIVKAMTSICSELGVEFHYNTPAEEILLKNGSACGVRSGDNTFLADVVVSGADYKFTETLLPDSFQQFSEEYWNKRVMAPSSLLFYIGVKGSVDRLKHHNLFFDEDFDQHAEQIYDHPEWPEKPLFYVSAPSKTDPSVAPEGYENLFILIPIAPDLDDPEDTREVYFNKVMDRLEKFSCQNIREQIVFRKSFCVQDFKEAYNSFRGNAYGMANTLLQTAYFRPGIRSKKVKNLYFTGQLTVPGPGVPPAIISGEIVAKTIKKDLQL